MNQEVKRIKMEDKKAMGKFFGWMICSLLVGIIAGVGIVLVKFFGIEMLNEFFERLMSLILTYGMPVVTVVITCIVVGIYCKSRKEFKKWDGESEEPINSLENWLSYGVWLVSINIICNYFIFGAAFCGGFWDKIENQQGMGNIWVMIGIFIASLIITIVEQQKIVNFKKEINPEKVGSIYDLNFQKKWEDSCDEAEKLQIYKSGYRAFRVTQNLCIGLWLFCVLGGYIWNFGMVPVLMVIIIWAVAVTTYCMESIRLSKKGDR